MSKSFNEKDLRMFLLEMASYQDNLLQTYRNIFITSQTIVISIAAYIVAFPNSQISFPFIFLLIIGVTIIVYWIKITSARGLDISYCHMQLEKAEMGELNNSKPFRSFKDWQNKKPTEKIRILKTYDREYDRKISKSYTRKVMGQKLPIAFSIVWILLFLMFILNL